MNAIWSWKNMRRLYELHLSSDYGRDDVKTATESELKELLACVGRFLEALNTKSNKN